MAHIIMLIVTIICIILIIYNLVIDGPIINVFLIAVTQSIILFLIRYLWINQSLNAALKHSFDLLTLMIVVIYLIYEVYKKNECLF
ncbi:hypothetical protein [Staphylococcus haemolyticus]|uniref:hypothetical protein n=1 Tax=Staphylococcus haemolyticus TaxID=1283 RepID=UPI0034D73271